MRYYLIALVMVFLVASASAEITGESVAYKHGDVVLEGYVAYNDATDDKRPGVLVVHEWTGLGDYTRSRCHQLAELGYVAFAVDMYGKGIRPQTTQEAAEQASKYRGDRQLMRDRVNTGLDELRRNSMCDTSRIAAIGYCFGGGTVLELARSGARLEGVVSFHGNLDTPDPGDAENIRCQVLVCHGADDPHVPWDQVVEFRNEMSNAGVDYRLIAYGGAVHSFTNPNSGDDPSTGVAYDADADRRSWAHMKLFFDEVLR
ncbi:prolyl oligopeptidase family serine peptidase [candidate division GN15 bacterium]|nr:prolyl oligopeptidase family serine peptidase [candidate division GN15 bacterium]